MKAFMSERADRLPISETAHPMAECGDAHGQAALREARRILAETEPETNAWRAVDWRNVREPFTYLRSTLADVALAEALAAFVESPDPEGWLWYHTAHVPTVGERR